MPFFHLSYVEADGADRESFGPVKARSAVHAAKIYAVQFARSIYGDGAYTDECIRIPGFGKNAFFPYVAASKGADFGARIRIDVEPCDGGAH